MRRIVFVLAFAIAGGAACSLFVSTDGLQDGEITNVSDSGGGDTSTFDSSADAISDAGSDAFDANTPFCASHPGHTFCADFDESADAAAGWTGMDVAVGTLGLSTGTFLSPPASLVSNDPAFPGTNEGEARLALAINQASVSHVHVELEVNVCETAGFDDGGYVELFKLYANDDFGSSGTELKIGTLGAYVDENASGMQYPLSQTIPAGAWTHVAFDIVIGTHGSYTITLNNSAALALDALDADVTSESYSGVLIGLYGTGAPACISYFDNILLDVN